MDTGGYQYLADYRLAPQRFRSVRLLDLLAGNFEPSLFDDRIAILGVTADSFPDLFYVPFERDGSTEIPGAVLHAHLASQMIRYALGEGSAIQILPTRVEALLIALSGALAALLALWASSLGRFALTAAIGIPGLWAAGFTAMTSGWLVPVVPAALAWTVSASVVTAYLAGRVRAERSELMNLFSRHVAKEVAEEVWENREDFMEGGRPKPRRLTATVLFVDMQGYTSRADSLDPGDLMDWLSGYLDLLSQDIMSSGGLIDDYFGDGIMACFGLPVPRTDPEAIRKDAQAAVSCALSFEKSVRRLNEEWASKGYPTIGIRVGLCTGELVAGTVGSAERLKYSIVGDVVVTAQRLESLDHSGHDFEKEPIRVLITDATLTHLGDDIETRSFGSEILKGRSEPVAVYRVMGTLR